MHQKTSSSSSNTQELQITQQKQHFSYALPSDYLNKIYFSLRFIFYFYIFFFVCLFVVLH